MVSTGRGDTSANDSPLRRRIRRMVPSMGARTTHLPNFSSANLIRSSAACKSALAFATSSTRGPALTSSSLRIARWYSAAATPLSRFASSKEAREIAEDAANSRLRSNWALAWVSTAFAAAVRCAAASRSSLRLPRRSRSRACRRLSASARAMGSADCRSRQSISATIWPRLTRSPSRTAIDWITPSIAAPTSTVSDCPSIRPGLASVMDSTGERGSAPSTGRMDALVGVTGPYRKNPVARRPITPTNIRSKVFRIVNFSYPQPGGRPRGRPSGPQS